MAESKEQLLIDVHELSQLICVSSGTLYHWVSANRIPYVRLSARCLRFSPTAIREWLAQLSEVTVTEKRAGRRNTSLEDAKKHREPGGQ